MYRFIHEFLKWLPQAIFAAVIGIAATVIGIASVWSQARDWIGKIVGQWWSAMSHPAIALIVVILVVVYFATLLWTAKKSLKTPDNSKAPRLEIDQLYLYKNTSYDDNSEKSYIIVWSPEEYFFPVFSDYESRACFWPPKPPKEKSMVFHLFNPGPSDIRHLRVDWTIKDINVRELIEESGLFGDMLKTVTDNYIKVINDGVGSFSHPFSTKGTKSIPIIKSGETIAISPPDIINEAFVLYALAIAKEMTVTPPASGISALEAALEAQKRTTVRIPPITIEMSYPQDDSLEHKQLFVITGFLRGSCGRVVSAKSNQDGGFPSLEEGITGLIEHMEVITL